MRTEAQVERTANEEEEKKTDIEILWEPTENYMIMSLLGADGFSSPLFLDCVVRSRLLQGKLTNQPAANQIESKKK